jgi:hypothetical protein
MIVRKPDKNFDDNDPISSRINAINGVWYSGVDRLPWWDLVSDYYAGKMPVELHEAFAKVKSDAIHIGDLDVCQDYETAKSLLAYSNQDASNNELIAVYSDLLASFRKTIAFESERLLFLGYDVMAQGEWSLLGSGVFVRPDYFKIWVNRLNLNGLLDSLNELEELVALYNDAVQLDLVEELAENFKLHSIFVYRVKTH